MSEPVKIDEEKKNLPSDSRVLCAFINERLVSAIASSHIISQPKPTEVTGVEIRVGFEKLGVTHREEESSSFSCRVPQPAPVDASRAEAQFGRRILEITLPRKGVSLSRQNDEGTIHFISHLRKR